MPDKRKILIFERPHVAIDCLFKMWIDCARQFIEERGQFSVAISGGKTPVEFYCKLSGLDDFDLWKRTHIFLTDERFVSFESRESNFRIIQENLIDYINIPQENIHPIRTDTENVALAADYYEQDLIEFFRLKGAVARLPMFDFILLGMGEDGHTASLFPQGKSGSALSQEGEGETSLKLEKFVIPAFPPHKKNKRVSLTLPVINNARNIIFLVFGDRKADVVSKVIEEGNMHLPSSKVMPVNGNLVYLLDRGAASNVSYLNSCVHCNEAISVIK